MIIDLVYLNVDPRLMISIYGPIIILYNTISNVITIQDSQNNAIPSTSYVNSIIVEQTKDIIINV